MQAAHLANSADPRLLAKTWEASQWALRTTAGAALTLMTARHATGSEALASIVRERQDTEQHERAADRRLSDALGRGDGKLTNQVRGELGVVTERLKTLDARLARDFPDYAEFSDPKPASIVLAQAALQSDEALVTFLETPRSLDVPAEAFGWAVTKTDARWVKLSFSPAEIASHVAALRCGLDAGSWRGAGESRCQEKVGTAFTAQDAAFGRPLPFDLRRARALHAALLDLFADMIGNKKLIIVPSGVLATLPFGVLVADEVQFPEPVSLASSEYGAAPPWLALRQPITVLPSVASLLALRHKRRTAPAPEPFIGFGDPALDGSPGCPVIIAPDQCPGAEKTVARATSGYRLGFETMQSSAEVFRKGLADVDVIRKLCPLPDTAHELRCVAKSLRAPESNIHLGAEMTEAKLKKLPLERYRVVHFATHGLLSADSETIVKRGAEPALVLTPRPQQPNTTMVC